MNYIFMDYWYFVKVTDMEQSKGSQGLGLTKDLLQRLVSAELEESQTEDQIC